MGTMTDETFADLFDRHAGLIRRVASVYCRDAAAREDVAQEIALQAWRSRHRYDGRCKESTWLYRIAVNVAISHHRKERRRPERGLPLDEQTLAAPEAGAGAGAGTGAGEDARLLLRCIRELEPLDRALVLLYLDGNDHAAIAEVLGISASNVGTKLHRLKARMRAAFERYARPTPKESTDGTR